MENRWSLNERKTIRFHSELWTSNHRVLNLLVTISLLFHDSKNFTERRRGSRLTLQKFETDLRRHRLFYSLPHLSDSFNTPNSHLFFNRDVVVWLGVRLDTHLVRKLETPRRTGRSFGVFFRVLKCDWILVAVRAGLSRTRAGHWGRVKSARCAEDAKVTRWKEVQCVVVEVGEEMAVPPHIYLVLNVKFQRKQSSWVKPVP